jgi:hypothetical protein
MYPVLRTSVQDRRLSNFWVKLLKYPLNDECHCLLRVAFACSIAHSSYAITIFFISENSTLQTFTICLLSSSFLPLSPQEFHYAYRIKVVLESLS